MQKNKLIHDFVNSKQIQSEKTFIPKGFKVIIPEYNTIDSLIPAINKIRKLGFRIDINITSVDHSVYIYKGEERLNFPAYSDLFNNMKVAITQFIEWYNAQKK